ncbi:energy transducer TonB [Defluviicoccus vanus]|uniref:Energy transducer TonB n=1 Tax=Defluviicoccus vanus TaxID=111831 RepID=A0A7H1MY49_9PROT|nr:energy transducer TonB [Defluviicoccus vanus]
MTAATIPPQGTPTGKPTAAPLVEFVSAAGDYRRPSAALRRSSLTGAVIASAILHAGICGLTLSAALPTSGSEPEAALTIELIMDAPTDAVAGEAAASGSAAPGPSPDVAATESSGAVAVSSAADDTIAAPQPSPQARPPTLVKAAAAPQRQVKPLKPRAAATPLRKDAKPAASVPDGTAAATNAGEAASAVDDPAGSVDAAGPPTSSGRAGVAMAGAVTGREELLAAYGRTVRAQIVAHKPRGVRLPGRAEISFTVTGDGTLLGARIAGSSGNTELDRLALLAVQAAAPLPPPPAALGTQPLTFTLPFTFR